MVSLAASPIQTHPPKKDLPHKTKESAILTSKKLIAKSPAVPQAEPRKGLSKLRKMLYLQSDRCFFCGEPLQEEDASIEHLNPLSRGGTKTEDNEVVCHKLLNETFGQLDLKSKFAFVLRSNGSFRCPSGARSGLSS